MSKIFVNANQKGNPTLKWLTNVAWEWKKSDGESEKFLVDYQIGETIGVLFLSVQYHRLHPDYIYDRLKAVYSRLYRQRLIILYLGDMKDNEKAIAAACCEVTRIACKHNFTVLCAWGWEEVAKIMELCKSNEYKPPDRIKQDYQKRDWSFLDRLESVLCKIKSVNRTDVVTLITHFQSVAAIAAASVEDLMKCPGIAKLKAQRISEAFRQPIKIAKTRDVEIENEKDAEDEE